MSGPFVGHPPGADVDGSPSAVARLPLEHAERRVAADEVHARVPEPLTAPVRASFIAVVLDATQRALETEHVGRLCATFGIEPPGPDARHFRAVLGPVRLRWERRTEFSVYTFFADGLSPMPFSEPAAALLPPDWIESIPGRTIVAAHAKLFRDDADAPSQQVVDDAFGRQEVVGSIVADGAGTVLTDFRIRPDGYVRFVVHDRGFTPRQGGRTIQRLFEIEAYRVMALLALPLVRELAPQTAAIEGALETLAAAIADQSAGDETLLVRLTPLAAEVEHLRNASATRLAASRAYHELVQTRIAELRERRLPGFQTIGEFMSRRLTPAMATCASASRRLEDLSGRVAQASNLLSARVEIVRERQNQKLLESMDRRARMQLRLQRTVEWLSVAAVTYYGAALVAYVAKAAKAGGAHVDVDLAVGLSIPVIAALVGLALHRARRASG